ncbi:MAG: hypothetical protein RI955_1487 [Bacteroidota bacterium]|jgi:outer membrane protein TolC
MNNKLKTVLLLLIGNLFFLSSSNAQQSITLKQAMDMAMQHSPALQISKLKTDINQSHMNELYNSLIPSVSLMSNYTRISNNIQELSVPFGNKMFTLNPQILDQFYNRVSVQEPIFTGFKTYNYASMFKSQLEASKADALKDASDLRLMVANNYFNLYKAIESKRLMEENLKILEARITDVKNFETVGMALDNDVLKAELLKSNVEISKSEVENMIATINYNLNILLGLPENTELKLNDDDVNNMPEVQVDGVFQTTNRSEWMSAKLRADAMNSSLKIAKSAYFPIVSAGFNYYYNQPNQRVFPPEWKFKNTWDAGITLNWNLTQLFTAKANIRESKSNVKMSQLAMEQINDGLKSEVFSTQKNYLLQKKKLRLTEQSLVQAKENQRIMKNRFDNQTALFSDLIDADAQSIQSQINQIQAKCDAMVAYYKYMRSIEK